MLMEDRKVIENKYHKQDEPFDPYKRMAYHGYDFDETTGLSDAEIIEGLKELSARVKDLPHPVQKAMAVEFALSNTRIDVNEHDYFIGVYSLNRLADRFTSEVWYRDLFDYRIPNVKEEMRKMNDSGATAIWPDFDHVIPDWNSVLTLGFGGLLRRAEHYRKQFESSGDLTEEKRAFFDGITIEYKAIINFCDRVYRYSLTKRGEKVEKISECFLHLRDGAPTNIYEAMQTMFVYFIVSECFDSYQVRSLGNGLDYTLYGFYEKDLRDGKYTREEIGKYLEYFLFQWSAIGNYWGQPFYLGGTDKDGSAKYNDLSYDILDAYDRLNIYNPKIQIKVNENTPQKLLDKVLDMVRRGNSSFVFVCEPGMIKAVMSYGATYDEAREMDIRGCYETGVKANEVSTVTGYVNAAKAVEYVFSNGYDKTLGEVFGLKTGEIGEKDLFLTFDDFYAAVLKQWRCLIERTFRVADEYEKYLSFINPSNIYSATIENALKKGMDAYQNGVKFNNSSVLNCGFATLVDSVMAVKEFVYDKKKISLSELKKALDDDWRGYELLRSEIRKSNRKYGNDDYETDSYAEALAAFFSNIVNNRKNARGGVYKSLMHTAMQFLWEGEKTAATPDGRALGDEIAKNGTPSICADKNGVTAMIKSALNLKPYRYSESFCLDVTLHPTACSGEDGLAAMKGLIYAYMRGNGLALQFNLFDAAKLRDAQKNPDKYGNLQVRVCGWNVLWNNLSEKEQNAYIDRAENIL